MRLLVPLKQRLSNSSGFTLIEVVLAIGIIGLIVVLSGPAFSEVISLQGSWQDEVVATKDLRHAGSWFAGDSLNAEDVLDSNGDTLFIPPGDPLVCSSSAPPITLKWFDTSGGAHNAIYLVSGESLKRDFDGAVITLAPRVVANSVNFTLCGNLLTLDMVVKAEASTTESMSLQTYLRKLE